MAEVAAPARPHTSFERDSVPSAAHRAALLSLLGAHAVPVWGWGERGAYAELVMDGPSLDHIVASAQLDRARLDDRTERWLELARDFAERTAALERQTAWIDLGIAQALDPDAAMARVEARLRRHQGGS